MSQEDFDFLSEMMDNFDDDDSGGLDFDEFMTFMRRNGRHGRRRWW